VCFLAAIITSFLDCGVAASPPESAECGELYEIAVATALPILPTPLHAFFETRLEALRQAAAPGARVALGSKMTGGEPQWHYVTLDIAAGAADRSEPSAEGGEGSGPSLFERRVAARRFPQERDKAMALYESCGVPEGGLLPWVVQDRYEAAVQAFRSGEPERIVAEAGVLLHFCVDAAMPCNTATERPRRQREQTELFNRLKKRLEYEVRVAPDRLSPVTNALEATFDVLLEAHRAADALIPIDAAVLPAEREAYVEKLAERAAPILETQIESGALLAANLIAAAWSEAGNPELRTTAVLTPPRVVPVPHAVAVLYVGARNSTVYHHPTCSHVPRIKPENRVTFDTQEQARAAGRTPCKTCKPDTPDKPPPR
jgi:methylphosphotriester-DNA--protein-cysteine methyltransferase